MEMMKTAVADRERIKILFIRPPYHLWPIINESDNFLLPLAFPCLAAHLREHIPGVEIIICDCLPLKIGWKSLAGIIRRERPDVVGVGDMTVYMHEGVKALAMAKEILPEVVTIAGGHFHSAMPRYSLEHYPQIDFVVRFEGEETLVELIRTLSTAGDPSGVKSIAYREDGRIVETEPRPLIDDLDKLPMPAYDLMRIDKYSPFGMLWPKAITVQAGRGCPYSCEFCSWSALEGEHFLEDGRIKTVPRFRIKSADKVIDEIDYLYREHNIRYLFWVDGTWNMDNEWLDDFCSKVIRRGYRLGWWAFVRADLMIEQDRLGILDKMVRAGLRHTLIGGERPLDEELISLGKTDTRASALVEACHMLDRKYPQVFRQSTFLTGIRNENPESMERLGRFARDAHLDFAAFHPLMPYPGTLLWEKANEEGWIEVRDFRKYDMFFPIMPSEHLTREEISRLTQKLYLDFVRKQPLSYLKGMFSPYSIRRRLHWWFLFAINRVLIRDMLLALLGRKRFEGFAAVNKLWKPRWYDS